MAYLFAYLTRFALQGKFFLSRRSAALFRWWENLFVRRRAGERRAWPKMRLSRFVLPFLLSLFCGLRNRVWIFLVVELLKDQFLFLVKPEQSEFVFQESTKMRQRDLSVRFNLGVC